MEESKPQIEWDGDMLIVIVPMQDGHVMEAKWKPDFTYVVRVRESGTDEWSFGFETPITHCTLVDLKPGTEYQVQVRTKHAGREGEPTYAKIHTNPKGIGENVIPFQKR